MKKEYFLQKQLFISMFLIIFLTMATPNKVYAQKTTCEAQLEFVNDRPNKKAGISGVYYRMKLTNTGTDNDFVISMNNSNPTNQSDSKRINTDKLSITVLDIGLNELKTKASENGGNGMNTKGSYKVFLNANEEIIFYIKPIFPNGATFGSMNSTKIEVTSSKCPDLNIYKVLNTEYVNGD